MGYNYIEPKDRDESHLINTIQKIGYNKETKIECLKVLQDLHDEDYTVARVDDSVGDVWIVEKNYKPFERAITDIAFIFDCDTTLAENALYNSRLTEDTDPHRLYWQEMSSSERLEIERFISALEGKTQTLPITKSNSPSHIINKERPTLNQIISNQTEETKNAVILAAKLTAGKAINAKAVKLIKPQLPMMARGYADHPLFQILLANLVGGAIKAYLPDNEKANQVSELMLQSAAIESMEAFDIEGMLSSLLEGVKLPSTSKSSKAKD